MSNGFIYVVDAHFIDKIEEEENILDPSACDSQSAGADPGFQVRGVHLKKSRRAEGGTKIYGVFRVKNHDFTHTKIFFPPILGGKGVRAPLDLPLVSANYMPCTSKYMKPPNLI